MLEYYIYREGKQVGPYSQEQIRSRLKSGEFQDADLFWDEGLNDWVPLTRFPSSTGNPADRTADVPSASKEWRKEDVPLAKAAPVEKKSWASIGNSRHSAPSRWYIVLASFGGSSIAQACLGRVDPARILGGTTVTFLVAILLSLLCPKKWRFAGALFFVVVISLLGWNGGRIRMSEEAMQAFLARYLENMQTIKKDLWTQTETAEASKLQWDKVDATMARLRTETAGLDDHSLRLVNSMLEVTSALFSKQKGIHEAMQKLSPLLDKSVDQLAFPEDYDTMTQGLHEVDARLVDGIAFLKNIDEENRTVLRRNKISEKEIDDFIRGMHQTATFEKIVELWQISRSSSQRLDTMYTILRERWGLWWLEGEQITTLQDEEWTDKYNKLVAEAKKDEKRTTELRSELMK